MIIYREYLLTFVRPHLLLLLTSTPAPPPQPPATPAPFFQIWILCQNTLTRELTIRLVGFVLKKLFCLTYFEMLIVPHALHCSDVVFFLHFTSFDSLAYCFGFSAPPPRSPPLPPPPLKQKIFTYFEILIVPHFTSGTCSVSHCECLHISIGHCHLYFMVQCFALYVRQYQI